MFSRLICYVSLSTVAALLVIVFQPWKQHAVKGEGVMSCIYDGEHRINTSDRSEFGRWRLEPK